jgi:hypothetical protein
MIHTHIGYSRWIRENPVIFYNLDGVHEIILVIIPIPTHMLSPHFYGILWRHGFHWFIFWHPRDFTVYLRCRILLSNKSLSKQWNLARDLTCKGNPYFVHNVYSITFFSEFAQSIEMKALLGINAT